MKRLMLMMVLVLSVMMMASARGRVTRDTSVLPAEAREFIKTQFPSTSISYLKVDKGMFNGNSYEVRLADGTELDFNSKGEWTEIDCEPRAVPSTVIPETISQYMKQHYARQRIVKIERSRKGYELKLENDLEVDFDTYGNFLHLSR
ncbi:MAG: PepSY-like domain-containing protein [Bacteroidaceae bacterium]|nr:PepSY-like domain-containing protein [Bacteroidaceae bacterium]